MTGQRIMQLFRQEPLLICILLAVIMGMVTGAVLRGSHLSARNIELIGLLGELMIRGLKMLVLPLVAGCMVASVCALSEVGSGMGRTAAWTLGTFLLTTSMSAGLGVAIAVFLHPGHAGDLSSSEWREPFMAAHVTPLGQLVSQQTLEVAATGMRMAISQQPRSPADAFLKLLRDLIPDNIVAAATDMNLLGIIFFSVGFGIALSLTRHDDNCQQIMRSVVALNQVIIKMVTAVIYVSPVGIASLIAANLCKIEDLAGTARALGMYIAGYIMGLAVLCIVMYPLVHWCCTRKSLFPIYRGFATALVTVFGTDSSIATLPVTLRCAAALHISEPVAQFVLPLGANINMNGTAFFEAFTVIFIAQAHGVSLDMGQYTVIGVCAVLAAISAAAIPSAGLVSMVMVMQAANLDAYLDDIGIIFALDWLLDRCRSIPNVLGDGVTAAIVQHKCNGQLDIAQAPSTTTDDLQDLFLPVSSSIEALQGSTEA